MLKNDIDSGARDHLALMRTHMANERTLLAYLRTALMLIATGGTVLKLLADTLPLHIVGWALIAIGVVIAILGARRYRRYLNEFTIESSNNP